MPGLMPEILTVYLLACSKKDTIESNDTALVVSSCGLMRSVIQQTLYNFI